MAHKYLDGDKYPLMNLINYMTDYNKKDFVFEGFIPTINNFSGIDIEGINYLAVHLSTTPVRKVISDDHVKEERYILSGKSWVAILYGSDNCSYVKRFDNKERMYKWFKNLKSLSQDDSWCWYNS